MNTLYPVAAVISLAFAIEGMIEYFIGTPFEKLYPKWSWLLVYVAFLVAIIGVWTYKLDLLHLWLGLGDSWTWFGLLLSAAMIGRGSNWLHEFASKYLKKE